MGNEDKNDYLKKKSVEPSFYGGKVGLCLRQDSPCILGEQCFHSLYTEEEPISNLFCIVISLYSHQDLENMIPWPSLQNSACGIEEKASIKNPASGN